MKKQEKATAESVSEPKLELSRKTKAMMGIREEKATKPKAEPRPCVCGCGSDTKGGLFVAGHNRRVHIWFAAVKEGAFLAAGLRTPGLQEAYARWDGNCSMYGRLKAAFGASE